MSPETEKQSRKLKKLKKQKKKRAKKNSPSRQHKRRKRRSSRHSYSDTSEQCDEKRTYKIVQKCTSDCDRLHNSDSTVEAFIRDFLLTLNGPLVLVQIGNKTTHLPKEITSNFQQQQQQQTKHNLDTDKLNNNRLLINIATGTINNGDHLINCLESLQNDSLSADMHRLPFCSDKFDGAICIDLLHHSIVTRERSLSILIEISRVLRVGGEYLQ